MSHDGPERWIDPKRDVLSVEQHAARAVDGEDDKRFEDATGKDFDGGEEFRGMVEDLRTDLGLTVWTPKEEEPRIITFSDATEKLKGIIDLEQAREQAVRDHRRWGLVQFLIKEGVVGSDDQYGALFDEWKFTEGGLQDVATEMDCGRNQVPIFAPGGLVPREGFEALFERSGIPHWTTSYAFENLHDLRVVDPNEIEDLQRLHRQSEKDQRRVWKEVLQSSPVVQPGTSKVLFTPDDLEVTLTGQSAVQRAQAYLYEGVRYTDPFSDWVRFRTQVDQGLRELLVRDDIDFDGLSSDDYQRYLKQSFDDKDIDSYLPDRRKITQYPLYGFENGGVLDFYWDPCYREVRLNGYYPDIADDYLGPRCSRS